MLEEALRCKHIDVPERYLLGIARRIAERNRQTSIYDRLVDLRGLAGDLALRHLTRADERRRTDLTLDEYLDVTLADALDPARPFIHRAYLRRCVLTRLRQLSERERHSRCRRASKQIAVSYSITRNERRQFQALLAEIAVPLTGA